MELTNGMSRLVDLIGPAPSEAQPEELLARVRIQRERVRKGLLAFRQTPKPKKAAKGRPPKSDKAKFTALAKRMNMTLEEFKVHMKGKGIDIDQL